jgi:uncharacterized membrane protein
VHVWMDGWDWLWMSFMMVFWLVVLGAVIYWLYASQTVRRTDAADASLARSK